MSRRRRRRHTPVLVVFLALCALGVGAWLLSYCDGIFSSDGAVRIVRVERSASGSEGARYFRARADGGKDVGVWLDLRRGTPDRVGSSFLNSNVSSSWQRLGFESHRGTATYQAVTKTGGVVPGSFSFHLLAVPYWFIVLPLATVPAGYGLLAGRRQRRRRKGLCPRCGYDLRASTGRCPECGLRVRRRFLPTATEPAPVPAS